MLGSTLCLSHRYLQQTSINILDSMHFLQNSYNITMCSSLASVSYMKLNSTNFEVRKGKAWIMYVKDKESKSLTCSHWIISFLIHKICDQEIINWGRIQYHKKKARGSAPRRWIRMDKHPTLERMSRQANCVPKSWRNSKVLFYEQAGAGSLFA